MLKKRYIFDTGVCKLYEFFSDVVIATNRKNVVGFPQQDYVAYVQTLYDGQYSLVIAVLPPSYRLLQSNNHLVCYISFTFSCYKEMNEFLHFIFVPLIYSFDKVYKYKRKTLSTKTLIYNYKRFVDYAVNVIE